MPRPIRSTTRRWRRSWSWPDTCGPEFEQGQARQRHEQDQGRRGEDPGGVGQGHGASALEPAPGRGPGQQPISAAEQLEAEAIRNMSMAEYSALRAEFGIRSPTDMNRLFGEQR